eukprot:4407372-Pyramimonas_sp.AAC.1
MNNNEDDGDEDFMVTGAREDTQEPEPPQDLAPGQFIRGSVYILMEKLDQMPIGTSPNDVRARIRQYRWSFFNVQLMWAAARDDDLPPMLAQGDQDLVPGLPPGIWRLPNGWRQMRNVDLQTEIDVRIHTMKAVPKCIRAQYLRILTQCLGAVAGMKTGWVQGRCTEGDCITSWMLLLHLPRMLLHNTPHGGDAGTRGPKSRIAAFDRGEWDVLLESARTQLHRQEARQKKRSKRTGGDAE